MRTAIRLGSLIGIWVMFLSAQAVFAETSVLDTSFNSSGIVTTFFPGTTTSEEARAVAIQSDSKIVVVGRADNEFAVARLNSNGLVDTSFGVGGKLTTDFAGSADAANGVAIQADGKIVVAGVASVGAYNNFAVSRYTTNGTLDVTFGTGGKATFGFGVSSYRDYANAVAIHTDGKIVLAGTLSAASTDFCVARLNTDGTLDTSFGSGGFLRTDFPEGLYDEAWGVAIQPDGKIIAVGQSAAVTTHDSIGIARYNADGSLDTAFGSNGLTRVDYLNHTLIAHTVAVQPDGQILVGGRSASIDTQGITGAFVLARLTTNGAPDCTFGITNGVLARSIVGSSNNAAYGMVLQPDGKIVLCGSSDPTSHGTNDFVLWRFNSNGTTDKTTRYYSANPNVSEQAKAMAMQADGRIVAAGCSSATADASDMAVFQVTTNLDFDPSFSPGPGTNNHIAALSDFPLLTNAKPGSASRFAIQPDGKIIAVGNTTVNPTNQQDGAVARYLPNGALDTSFGSGGLLTIDRGQKFDSAVDVLIQPDGKIVVALGVGYNPADTNNEPCLQRLLPDGTPDSEFGQESRACISFGHPSVPNSTAFKTLSRIQQQADGKILVIGNVIYTNNTSDSVLSRINADGTLDTSFGTGGTVSCPGEKYGKTVVVQADGGIVTTTTGWMFRRFLTNGTPDTSFGNQGVFTAPVGGQLSDMILLSDGRIAGVGYSAAGFLQLICLTTNGNLDSAFGNGGVASNSFGGRGNLGSALTLQRDGKILICGSISFLPDNQNYMLARFLTNGVPDNSFGTNGMTAPKFGYNSTPRGIALQRDGRIVLLGTTYDNNNWSLLRFLNDQTNMPPVISGITNQEMLEDTTLTISFTVSDWETLPDSLTVSAFSSNTNLLSWNGLLLGGSGIDRTLSIFPAANASGTATVTIEVNDGLTNTVESFQLTVTAVNLPPLLGNSLVSSNGLFSIQLNSESGKTYGIEASEDLTHWSSVHSVSNATGSIVLEIEGTRTNSQRFFRARIP